MLPAETPPVPATVPVIAAVLPEEKPDTKGFLNSGMQTPHSEKKKQLSDKKPEVQFQLRFHKVLNYSFLPFFAAFNYFFSEFVKF